MHYIIFDLESTCWLHGGPVNQKEESEIIEIGAIKLNSELELVDRFERFIKPVQHPELSDFCKELTTITQEQVDSADTFIPVMEAFRRWIGEEPAILCSWGEYDRRQTRMECERNGLDVAWTDLHINVQTGFKKKLQMKKTGGMTNALKLLGLEHAGVHHRGIDDAVNISNIFREVFSFIEYSHLPRKVRLEISQQASKTIAKV